MLKRMIFERTSPMNLIIWPPIKARTMRTKRAKTVPPGAAIGPSIVQAERKTAAVVRSSVRECAQHPCGGQHEKDGDVEDES